MTQGARSSTDASSGLSVDSLASVSWLRFSNLFGETEVFGCAMMNEVILTNNYRKYIIKDETVDILVCRACHSSGESIRNIFSGCGRLANSEYLHRHNQVAKIIYQQFALHYRLVEFEVPYCKYVPDPVLEHGHITFDRTIAANKPDIVVIDRQACRMFDDNRYRYPP
uniref:SFRICE_027487 n=1 Tax=Spodoptera frugiperda TaxID=7108 RepID=A0A2H1WRZ1_SPOFR